MVFKIEWPVGTPHTIHTEIFRYIYIYNHIGANILTNKFISINYGGNSRDARRFTIQKITLEILRDSWHRSSSQFYTHIEHTIKITPTKYSSPCVSPWTAKPVNEIYITETMELYALSDIANGRVFIIYIRQARLICYTRRWWWIDATVDTRGRYIHVSNRPRVDYICETSDILDSIDNSANFQYSVYIIISLRQLLYPNFSWW